MVGDSGVVYIMVEGQQLSEQGDRSSVVCPGSSLLALKEGLLIDVQNLESLNFTHLKSIQCFCCGQHNSINSKLYVAVAAALAADMTEVTARMLSWVSLPDFVYRMENGETAVTR